VADEKRTRLDELEVADLNGEKTRIVELYTVHGCSLTYIAQVLGRSAGYVSRVLHAAYQEDKSERDVRVLAHSQTLQWLMTKTIKRIEKAGDRFDRRDAELWLKLREQEARLKGLDQPTRAEVTVSYDELSQEELIAQLEAVTDIKIILPDATQPAALPEHVPDADYQVKLDTSVSEHAETGDDGGR
jgi:hypothetical protein